MIPKKVNGPRPPKTRGSWIAPRSGGYQGIGSGSPKAPPSASLVPLPANIRPARPDPGWHKVPDALGRLGVEMPLPAPAEEVERNIKLGIDLAAGRAVTVACEIRDGVVYLLATHKLDR